ncbi:transglutaminase family protein [Demequina mangrovi]|uniref:Transglutaminase-like enzyme, putative cysteine protease n=1 Tax=Demequina mangrovi TaxID=1043493 RepID=A0A1H6ZE97_9MICO|nr:transglutaminaseTgpA domain-containing protein [Demequina mangrovi]SEJ47185.1 Transglutaminase-like enzyme, putative cysteine protease [Demequina mangrovi]
MSAGRWRLLATPLMAVAVGLGLAGLSGLVSFGAWLWPVAAILAATAAVITLARLATARPFLPTVAGALAGTWLLTVTYIPADDGGTRWIPGPGTPAAALVVLRDAIAYAEVTVAPAAVVPALAGTIVAGAVALLVVVDAMAVGAGFAASAGFILLVPWLPALTLERRIPTLALAGALAAWLAVVALSRRGEHGTWHARAREGAAPAPAGIAAAAIAATVAIGLAAAPLAIGGPGWGQIPRLTLPASLGGASRLDLEIDLRDSLTSRSSEPVLAYSSTGGRVDVLRAYSFSFFDGTRWDRDPEGATVPANGILWSEQVPSSVLDSPTTVSVSIGALAETRVPVPSAPRTLVAGVEWRYDSSTDEIVVDRPEGTQGLSYTVRMASDFTTEEALRAADALIDEGGDDRVPDRYLELNERIDIASVRAVAEAQTTGAADRYEAARMLQEYLRGPRFTYDTDVTPTGDDAVSTFLEERRGYCVQFATAMVVMARTLDIPARMAVGFLGGVEDGERYVVRGRDAHAWPELYFPGHGWVRFEPTPAVQTGLRPEYASVEQTDSQAFPFQEPNARSTVLPDRQPQVDQPDETSGGTAEEQAGFPWLAAGGAGLLAVAAGAAIWLRRRARADEVEDPEDAWAALRRGLGERAGDPSLTPAETEAWIVGEGPELGDEAREALGSLRAAVEDHRYSPRGTDAAPAALAAWADTVVEAAKEADRAAHARARS